MAAIQVIVREIGDGGRKRTLHQELRERESGIGQERQIRQMLVGAQMKVCGSGGAQGRPPEGLKRIY
jgi:hypothetical protein